ncbi:MAG: TIR domain-containing protein [Ruminococcaceae bacterium]|nr:TIR domain-containing protein [Oscillospiraceae bacterium]
MEFNSNDMEKRRTVRAPFRADEESPYVFVSYSHADRERVFPIIRRLYEQGWRVWYDEGLEIAENYLATLSRHIRNCAAFLLFVTENSVRSDFVCENELALASNCKKIIVQCVLDRDARFSGEAKEVIDIVTASPKHPRTDEAGLETALESVSGLTRGERRTAGEITVRANEQVITTGEGEKFEWTTCEGGVKLTGYTGRGEEVRIPSEYPAGSGKPVVELENTFANNKIVRRIWVPASVRNISTWAFAFCKDVSIYIPSTVREIHMVAFSDCEKVTVYCAEGSEAYKTLTERAIAYENFRVIPDSSMLVSELTAGSSDHKPYAYISYSPDQKRLAAQIMEKLTEVGCEVYDGGSVEEGRKLEVMRKSRCFAAFVSRSYIESACVEDLMYAADTGKKLMMCVLDDSAVPEEIAIRYPADQMLYYNSMTGEESAAKLVDWLRKNGCCRDGVPEFEYGASPDGITLTKYIGKGGDVVIRDEYDGVPVTRIGVDCFRDCTGVTSVTLPGSLAEVAPGAFVGCSDLKAFYVHEDNKVYFVDDGVLFDLREGSLSIYPNGHGSEYTVPGFAKSIRGSAFAACSGLKAVHIPDSITEIGGAAFWNCTGLVSVNIPDSVTRIENGTFYGCSSLTSVDLHNAIVSIGDTAFWGCSGLTTVFIPDSVTSVGGGAFYGCSSLTSVTIPGSIRSIGVGMFGECGSLQSVNIPKSVTSIGNGAFSKCSSLATVVIPDSVAEIGEIAFVDCGKLTDVIISNSVAEIEKLTFHGCKSLRTVTIPGSVKKIGDSAFWGCGNLAEVSMPDSVIEIGESAFSHCSGLTSVTIMGHETRIGDYVFDGCDGLTVYCREDSFAWNYCEENKIPHRVIAESSARKTAQAVRAEENEPGEASASASAAEACASAKLTDEPEAAGEPEKARRSRGWWLIPAALALIAGTAAAVQLTGVCDIVGAIGRLLG